jgi:hypothetical protein
LSRQPSLVSRPMQHTVPVRTARSAPSRSILLLAAKRVVGREGIECGREGESEEENWLAREAQGRDDWDGAGGRGSGRLGGRAERQKHTQPGSAEGGASAALQVQNWPKLGGAEGRLGREPAWAGRSTCRPDVQALDTRAFPLQTPRFGACGAEQQHGGLRDGVRSLSNGLRPARSPPGFVQGLGWVVGRGGLPPANRRPLRSAPPSDAERRRLAPPCELLAFKHSRLKIAGATHGSKIVRHR